ncbi:MAG: MgtC/SapB family protein [Armatimonadetes bacterium]|nr:MgtC/SapB family protein [Armatimonadota bacterium]MDW8026939.1 MgtC/SapB family protein [Armatimonadota bacterium]
MFVTTWEAVIRVLLTMVLSGLIGAEREAHERPAGLRTHVLVGVGACLFMLLSLAMTELGGDPGRIAAQVVTGIGFIGAGTIWMRGDVIRGLTTAASIWATAAIGMLVGAGWYSLAIIAAIAVFTALTLMRRLERILIQKLSGQTVTVQCELPPSSENLWQLLSALSDLRARLLQVENLPSGDTDFQRVRLTLNLSGRVTTEQVIQALMRAGAVSAKTED